MSWFEHVIYIYERERETHTHTHTHTHTQREPDTQTERHRQTEGKNREKQEKRKGQNPRTNQLMNSSRMAAQVVSEWQALVNEGKVARLQKGVAGYYHTPSPCPLSEDRSAGWICVTGTRLYPALAASVPAVTEIRHTRNLGLRG